MCPLATSKLWLVACCCGGLEIRQCTANTRNWAEGCKGGFIEIRAQVQDYVNQAELTRELNLHCNYLTLVERHFRSKND